MHKIFGTDLIIISRIELYLLSYIRKNIAWCLSCVEILCNSFWNNFKAIESSYEINGKIDGICNLFKKWGKIDIYY